ncbi:MAG: DNA-binding protein [Phycisphaerales bacterium]|nr:MAG: DNA-binding protein [Phycisphaerales bacterium]
MAKTKSGAASGRTRTKSEILAGMAAAGNVSRKQVSAMMDELSSMIKKDLTRGPGAFSIPGLVKLRVIKKKATKARKGVNPFTGEEMMFKAKPARKVVKATALKALKDMV